MKQLFILLVGATCLMSCRKDEAPTEITDFISPPLSFELIDVPLNTIGASRTPTLTWESAKNPKGGEVTYDLYLGEETNPTTIYQSGITDTSFQIKNQLKLTRDYYWKVVAKDADGQTSQSNIYKFTTRYYAFPNEPIVTSANFSPRLGHSSTVFDNKLWVIGGMEDGFETVKNDVWYSSDGIDWNEAALNNKFTEVQAHQSVVFDNKIWIIAGSKYPAFSNSSKGEVWYSSDGVDWQAATLDVAFSARINHATVVFDDKIWVIGGGALGLFNDVWYSNDGLDWTEATSSAEFSKRSGLSGVVFNDKIWVIGGLLSANKVANDVWFSGDGVHWTEASAAAPFSKRSHHTTTVFDNKIWVIGGRGELGNDLKNDVWYSSDGINWTEATTDSFSERRSHTTTVFQDKLWLIGGGNFGIPNNDIWTLD